MSVLHPALGAPRLSPGGDLDLVIPFEAFLRQEGVQKNVCAKVVFYDKSGAAAKTTYWSSLGFNSLPTDTPASTHFEARLVDCSITRRAGGRNGYAGRGDLSQADIALAFTEGTIEIDGTSYSAAQFMNNFYVSERDIEIRLCTDSWDDGMPIVCGLGDGMSFSADGSLRIRFGGVGLKLDTEFQPATYGGTGGTDGTTDLEGKPKPVAIGYCRGIQPILEDPANQLFRVHTDADGNGEQIASIPRVQLGGTSLAFADDYATVVDLLAATTGTGGADIEPGEYGTCLAEGAFRLGTDDYTATLTCDVRGALLNGSFAELPGDVALIILRRYGAKLTAAELSLSAFTTLNTTAPYEVHFWASSEEDYLQSDVLGEVLESVGAVWVDTTDCKLSVQAVTRATGSSFLIGLTDDDIQQDTFSLGELPTSIAPGADKVSIGYQRNYTVTTDVTGGTTADDRAFYAAEYRRVEADFTLTGQLGAKTYSQDTQITTQAGAEAYRTTRGELYSGEARPVQLETDEIGAILRLGDRVQLTNAQFGFSENLGVVIATSQEPIEHRTVLEILMELS